MDHFPNLFERHSVAPVGGLNASINGGECFTVNLDLLRHGDLKFKIDHYVRIASQRGCNSIGRSTLVPVP